MEGNMWNTILKNHICAKNGLIDLIISEIFPDD